MAKQGESLRSLSKLEVAGRALPGAHGCRLRRNPARETIHHDGAHLSGQCSGRLFLQPFARVDFFESQIPMNSRVCPGTLGAPSFWLWDRMDRRSGAQTPSVAVGQNHLDPILEQVHHPF